MCGLDDFSEAGILKAEITASFLADDGRPSNVQCVHNLSPYVGRMPCGCGATICGGNLLDVSNQTHCTSLSLFTGLGFFDSFHQQFEHRFNRMPILRNAEFTCSFSNQA